MIVCSTSSRSGLFIKYTKGPSKGLVLAGHGIWPILDRPNLKIVVIVCQMLMRSIQKGHTVIEHGLGSLHIVIYLIVLLEAIVRSIG